jgi:enterochelin esterase family protein
LNAAEFQASPRSLALAHQLADAWPALGRFWSEIEQVGTPLIDPIPGDDGSVLVTFVWRETQETRNVVVICQLNDLDADGNQMDHLAGTDIWFKSYRVPADVRQTYWFAPNDSLVSWDAETNWAKRSATWQMDPLNPNTVPETPPGSLLVLPRTPSQPWCVPRPNSAKGKMHRHRVPSTILGRRRSVSVYTPPTYRSTRGPYPLLVLLDGWAYVHLIPTPTILDNLIADGRLAPMVAAMIDNPSHEARQHDLACSPAFTNFLSQELIPWIHVHYQVATDPSQTIIGGSSLGGLCAAHAGLSHPDVFGKVLSQSGAFWWKPENDSNYEWLTRQLETCPRVRVDFHLDVGVLEVGRKGQIPPTILAANRHLRAVLEAKGYAVDYVEFSGGHDYVCWQGVLPDALSLVASPRRTPHVS